MPSKSVKQQRFFGLVLLCKETGRCKGNRVKSAADSMTLKEIKDFAKTKHKNINKKERVKKAFEFYNFSKK